MESGASVSGGEEGKQEMTGEPASAAMKKDHGAATPLSWQVAAVFLIASAAFVLLRSSDYFAVDGALRALEIFQKHKPFLHPNNHLLYPINVYVWSGLLSALRIRAQGPLGFLAIAQAMNAVAAAACVAILYGIAYRLTKRASVAALVAGGWGVSRAVLAHATNSAEPMVGVLWSAAALALLLYGISRNRRWPVAGAGLLLGLALATYQTMVLLCVPMLFLLCRYPAARGAQGPESNDSSQTFWPLLKSRLPDVGFFLASFAASIPMIYGTAYYLSGTKKLPEMVARFVQVDAAQVYGGASVMKLLTVLPGLTYALFPCLPQHCGFQCLAAPEHRIWIPIAAIAILTVAMAFIAIIVLTRKIWPQITAHERLAATTCGVGLIATIIPSVIWMPAYDKFWLQPLACLFLGAGVVLFGAWSLPDRQRVGVRLLPWLACVFVAVLWATNLAVAWTAARQVPPSFAEAQEVARLTGTGDLVVGDWNDVFLVYSNMWASRATGFNLPTQALQGAAISASRLRDAVQHTQQAGGKVFFLGVLDLSEKEWKPFLGDRLKLPYSALGQYRGCAQIVASFADNDRQITLQQYLPCDR
jgi:hypothetical protein